MHFAPFETRNKVTSNLFHSPRKGNKIFCIWHAALIKLINHPRTGVLKAGCNLILIRQKRRQAELKVVLIFLCFCNYVMHFLFLHGLTIT